MAKYVADFLQTGEQIVLGLVNNDNGTAFTPAQIIFGDVVASEDEETPLRTALELTAASGSGYAGSVIVNYNRVPLSFMNDLAGELEIVTDEATSGDLIDFLNEKFGIALTADDIVVEDLPERDAITAVDYSLKAAAASMVFAGAAALKLIEPKELLADVLTVLELDGLYAPTSLPGTDDGAAEDGAGEDEGAGA